MEDDITGSAGEALDFDFLISLIPPLVELMLVLFGLMR